MCSMRHGSGLNGMLFTNMVDVSDCISVYLGSQTSLLFHHTIRCSNMSIWLGPGLKFLQRTWRWNLATVDEPVSSPQELAELTLKFNGCLASSDWVDGSLPPYHFFMDQF